METPEYQQVRAQENRTREADGDLRTKVFPDHGTVTQSGARHRFSVFYGFIGFPLYTGAIISSFNFLKHKAK